MISARKSFRGSCMHFFCLMARNTIHVIFCHMHVTLTPHAIVFIAYPAAMACCTLVEGISAFLEDMTVDKTLLGKFWSADMTAAAVTGMAGKAMIFTGCIDLVPLVHVCPVFQDSYEG